MPAINRYTRLTPSTFNPMSLEEMMMVPLAKQKQQEDLLAAQDGIQAELNNMKRLQQDDPFVTEKTLEYKNQLDAISDTIAAEGINRDTTRNFRKLFSDYKFDISDSGDLGRAQNNYNLAKQREATSRKELAKEGHSQAAVDRLIEQGYQNFTGTLNDDGSYNEFGNFGGPGFYDYRKEAMDIFRTAAHNGVSIGSSGSKVQFIKDPTTGSVLAQVTNTQMTESEKENAEQIASALNSMMTSYSYGDRQEFAELYDLSPERLGREFKEMAGAYEFRQHAKNTQSRTSLQNLGNGAGRGRGGSSTTSPRGERWENIPVHVREGKDGGNPLGNRLMSDSNLTYRNASIGFRQGVIKDFRLDPNLSDDRRKAIIKQLGGIGAFGQSDGKTEIDGATLERLFLDSDFVNRPDNVHGAPNYSTSDGSMQFHHLIGETGLAIVGEYEGEKYNLVVKDPNIVAAFDKFATSSSGKAEYRKLLKERRDNTNSLRNAEPFLAGKSDQEINQLYTDAIAKRQTYFQEGYKPKNPQNSYYAQSEDLFGEKGSLNLGTIRTRKVRMFDEAGNELTDLKGTSGLDKLSNLLADNEYDDLDNDEKMAFLEQLRESTDYGLTVGDHEFVNPMRRSVTGPDGKEIFFMIDNNNELSAKNKEFPGIDDSTEIQRYLIEGKPFVNKGVQQLRTSTGERVNANQWFVQVPYYNGETLDLIPLSVYGEGDFNSLDEIMEAIDMENGQPRAKKGYKLLVETQDMVDARVKTNLNRYYDTVANQKTTNSRADKLYRQ